MSAFSNHHRHTLFERKRKPLPIELYQYDFIKLAENEKDPLKAKKLLCIGSLQEGKTYIETALFLKISPGKVYRWLNCLRNKGLQELLSSKSKNSYLSKEQVKQLEIAMNKLKEKQLISYADVEKLLFEKFNVKYKAQQGIYMLLKRYNISLPQTRVFIEKQPRTLTKEMYKYNFLRLSELESDNLKKKKLLNMAYYCQFMPFEEIAKQLKISPYTLNRWIKEFETRGLEGLLKDKTSIKLAFNYNFIDLAQHEKDLNRKIKLMCMAYRKEGKTLSEIACLTNVEQETIAFWIRKFQKGGLNNLLFRNSRSSVKLTNLMSAYNFRELAQHEIKPKNKLKLIYLALRQEGKNCKEASSLLCVNPYTAAEWHNQFMIKGLDGILQKKSDTISLDNKPFNLRKLARQSSNSAHKLQLLALAYHQEKFDNDQISQILCLPKQQIRRWVIDFKKNGLKFASRKEIKLPLLNETKNQRSQPSFKNDGESDSLHCRQPKNVMMIRDSVKHAKPSRPGPKIGPLPKEIYQYDFAKLSESEKNFLKAKKLLFLSYLREGKTYNEIAELVKIDKTTVYNWSKGFRKKGIERFLLTLDRKKNPLPKKIYQYDFSQLAENEKDCSKAKKLLFLAYLREGKTHKEIDQLLKISKTTGIAWLKHFKKNGIAGLLLSRKRNRKKLLPKEIYLYDFTKLANSEKDPLKAKKLLFLAYLREAKTHKEIAQLLKIAKSTSAKWLEHFRKKGFEELLLNERNRNDSFLSERQISQCDETVINTPPDKHKILSHLPHHKILHFKKALSKLRDEIGMVSYKNVQTLLLEKFNVSYSSLNSVRVLLRRLNILLR